jgi:hypothetical protein
MRYRSTPGPIDVPIISAHPSEPTILKRLPGLSRQLLPVLRSPRLALLTQPPPLLPNSSTRFPDPSPPALLPQRIQIKPIKHNQQVRPQGLEPSDIALDLVPEGGGDATDSGG